MTKKILLESLAGQTTLALLEDGELAELYAERKGFEKLTGNIYVGRVENVLPGMNAAFVNIGLEKNAFLYAGDIQLDTRGEQALEDRLRQAEIRKLVRPGQSVVVQIVKEPGGSKGPRVSCHITLPGRLTVLLPTVKYVGISRRIAEEDERARLREITDRIAVEREVGIIVRTAAQGASEQDLRADLDMQIRLWKEIEKRGRHLNAPALLHRDDSLTDRAVRDMLTEEVECVKTDDPELFRRLQEAASLFAPEYLDRIVLDGEATPLFVRNRVYAQAKKALDRCVWLKSGGYLVFDYTEALTVIDVNTGKYVGKRSLAETVLRTNCEAAREIARQLRLRDLGGIIVIDFIDMDLPEQRETLLEVFREALRADRTRTNLVGITSLGLVEMTRKKVRQPIHKLMTHICPECSGSGLVPSHEALARDILVQIRNLRREGDSAPYLVRASAPVAGMLVNLGAPDGGKVYVHPDPEMPDAEYDLTPVAGTTLPSYVRLLKR